MRFNLRSIGLMAFLASASAASNAWACPSCRDTVAGGDTSVAGISNPGDPAAASSGVAGGFNTSIYFMLGGFFAVLGTVGFTLYRGVVDSDAEYRNRSEE